MTTHQQAEDQLLRASERFLRACERIPEERWLARPARGGWSAGEVIEHVALANTRMSGVFERLESMPVGEQQLPLLDEEIPFVFYGGDEPPGIAEPTGTWVDIADAHARFETAVAAMRQGARSVGVDLRTVASPHAVFGPLDGVQWLLFAFAHTERHRGDLRQLAREFAG